MSAPEPRIVRSVAELRAAVGAWRRDGRRVGLTPTMGALHEGHLSLLSVAREIGGAERIVASLFVNPSQFGANEDFSAYPRDEARDAALLGAAGCHLLYAPSVPEMYPPGFATEVHVGGVTETLDGPARPGHFHGVAQVVTKLLNQAQADVAVFGEKDWQQLAVIRRLAADLDIPTEILGAPIIREADGLAMSSRNRYLTQEERARAPELFATLTALASAVARGDDPGAAEAAARDRLTRAGFGPIDYAEARDAETLGAPTPGRPARVFGAARLGKARLIDNAPVPWAETRSSSADRSEAM